ncbi:TVP38/TMEM64 family protein [Spirochaetia bacterium]|nr:TVP38/TMEM64 family protein [Spirochaetia bacterium]
MEKRKRNFIIFVILFCIITVVISVLFWPFISGLRDPGRREDIRLRIEASGWKGLLVILGIQILQVVVAVIPGEPVELLAGVIYGAAGGLALCLAGSTIASVVIFSLVRKFGAPLVEKFFRKDGAGRFAFLQNRRQTSLVVFILFLIPGTPKDTLTYLVPLGKISLARFIMLSSLARIPSILTSTAMGDQAIRGNWILLLMIFLFTAALGLAGILFSDKIINKLKGGEQNG